MKKKILAALLCLSMAATMLVGCGGNDAPADEPAATDEAGEVADVVEDEVAAVEDAFVGVFWYTFSDTYLSSVRTALDAELTGLGLEAEKGFMNYDANGSQTTQMEQIDTAIQMGATCLVVNVVEAGSEDVARQILDKATTAGVPVVFFNRSIEAEGNEGTVLGAYENCAFVGTDAPEAGHMQGKMIGEYLVANYDACDLNGDGQISYAMFMGQLGNAVSEAAKAKIEAVGGTVEVV